MRTAIDRLSIGIEKEIDILDFDGYRSQNRFVCPECGEYVFPAIGKRNGFRHHKGSSLDCDKRVDGNANLTFYERVGLPIFLINENNNFSLGIGFYALGNKVLEKAQKNNLKVSIKSKSNIGVNDLYLIDYTFYENEITIKQLNFIPYYNEDYLIEISNSKNDIVRSISSRWSDYADGFMSSGAIFFYSENKGKKFRKNDTITTNVEYFLLSFRRFPNIPNSVEKEYISSFKIGSKICYIYKIIIKSSNLQEFKYLENYFWSSFKLKLLYSKPEIIQLWPPSSKTDDINYTIPLKSNNNIFCKISSNAEKPKVYKYIGKDYNEISISKDTNGCYFIKTSICSGLQPLSVDRKYLANAQLFSTDIIFQTNNKIEIKINDINLLSNDDFQALIDLGNDDLTISSNINTQIIQILNDKSILKAINTPNAIDIMKIDNKSIYTLIYADDYGKFYFKYCKKNLDSNITLFNIDTKQLLRELSSQCIDIPMKYRNLKIKLKKHHKISKLIRPFLIKGKIPVGVLKILVDGGLFNE